MSAGVILDVAIFGGPLLEICGSCEPLYKPGAHDAVSATPAHPNAPEYLAQGAGVDKTPRVCRLFDRWLPGARTAPRFLTLANLRRPPRTAAGYELRSRLRSPPILPSDPANSRTIFERCITQSSAASAANSHASRASPNDHSITGVAALAIRADSEE